LSPQFLLGMTDLSHYLVEDMPIYEKAVRFLMRDMVANLEIQQGQTFSRDRVMGWFREHYPLIKKATVDGHLTRQSTNAPARINHPVSADGTDDLFYKIDGSTFRLYDPLHDPEPIRTRADFERVTAEEGAILDDSDETTVVTSAASSEFAYERDLRDYLAKNLHIISPDLTLYEEEGVRGVEFPVGGRYVDILARDSEGYVVIELKVSKGYDRVVGQLLRYVNWIKQNHAEEGQRVRGIIVAKQIGEDLSLACSEIPNVELYEYELSVTVTSHRK